MLTHELNALVKNILAELTSAECFRDGVADLAAAYDPVQDCAEAIAQGGNLANSGTSQLHSHFASISGRAAHINPRRFYADMEKVLFALKSSFANQVLPSDYLNDLVSAIEDFSDTYDRFIVSQTGKNAVPLLFKAFSLNRRIRDVESAVKFFSAQLEVPNDRTDSSGVLAISMPLALDFRDFVSRLTAIQRIYSELCQVLEVSETDEPLRISKIESGSLWAKVFGESRVLNLMESFIKSSAAFLYRNYTNEGKLRSIPGKIESLDSVLGFSRRLKDSGVDTNEMDEIISKAAVLISKDLTTLLDRQASVTVNGEIVSVGTEIARQQISLQNLPRLENITTPEIETLTPPAVQSEDPAK